ncbi:MAG: hypothetical protein ACLFRY_04880 [Spirochaetia bacterium]
MTDKNDFGPLRALGRIYYRIGRRLLAALLFVAGLAAAAAAVVFPVWLLAVQNTRLFTFIVLGLISAGIIFLFIRRIVDVTRNENAGFFRGFVARSVRFLIHVLFLFWIYGIAVFFMRGNIAAGIPLSLGLIIALGYYVYGRSINRI